MTLLRVDKNLTLSAVESICFLFFSYMSEIARRVVHLVEVKVNGCNYYDVQYKESKEKTNRFCEPF